MVLASAAVVFGAGWLTVTLLVVPAVVVGGNDLRTAVRVSVATAFEAVGRAGALGWGLTQAVLSGTLLAGMAAYAVGAVAAGDGTATLVVTALAGLAGGTLTHALSVAARTVLFTASRPATGDSKTAMAGELSRSEGSTGTE